MHRFRWTSAAALVGAFTFYAQPAQLAPAARKGDHHDCPMMFGPIPHAGGPIQVGDPSVSICGAAAARVGDTATCVNATDQVTHGSKTVRIGGKPAARIGDGTAHGGVIIAGCGTVRIGG